MLVLIARALYRKNRYENLTSLRFAPIARRALMGSY